MYYLERSRDFYFSNTFIAFNLCVENELRLMIMQGVLCAIAVFYYTTRCAACHYHDTEIISTSFIAANCIYHLCVHYD